MPLSQGAQAALLKWVNSGFETKHDVRSLRDLADGVILAQLVKEVDPEFDTTDIDGEPGSSWVAKRKNLRVVHRGLFRFVHHVAPQLDFLSKTANLADIEDGADAANMAKVCQNPSCVASRAAAAGKEDGETNGPREEEDEWFLEPPSSLTQFCEQLALAIMTTAFLGPDPNPWVRRLQLSNDEPLMKEIMMLLAEKKKEIEAQDSNHVDGGAAVPEKDHELEMEERYAKLSYDYEQLKIRSADTLTRYSNMKESYDMIKSENEKMHKQLEAFEKSTKDESQTALAVRKMTQEMGEKRDLISQLEAQLEEAETTLRLYTREVDTLKKASKDVQQLRDEVDSQKQKIDDLSRKANMVERLKQKLESQKNLVTEVENLRFEKSQLQGDPEGKQKLDLRCQTLERSLKELRNSLARAEESLFNANAQKRQLEQEYIETMKKNALMEAQLNYDERVIKEQQDAINSGSNSAMASPGLSNLAGVSLEQELNSSEGDEPAQPNLGLEVGRLKAENNLLRKGMGSEGETTQLRIELEETQTKLKKIQDQYNNVFERHALAQEQINALLNNASGEGLVRSIDAILRMGGGVGGDFNIQTDEMYRSQVFGNMRGQLMQANFDLEGEKRRARELEAELADRQRELLALQSDLSAVEKDGLEALEQLKSTDVLISASLREELDVLRSRMKMASVELEQQKSQLIDALVTKDKYRKELDEAKMTPAAPAAATTTTTTTDGAETPTTTSTTTDPEKSAKEKNEKLKTRLRERTEQLEQALADKHELQKTLKSAQHGSVSSSYKAESERAIKTLKREISLMSTAWYDLSSRIQSNHVVLQRRSDMPKSWLNKQRQLVNS